MYTYKCIPVRLEGGLARHGDSASVIRGRSSLSVKVSLSQAGCMHIYIYIYRERERERPMYVCIDLSYNH